jgi:hypothetical protein
MNANTTAWREPQEPGSPRRVPVPYLVVAGVITVAALIGWIAATRTDSGSPRATSDVTLTGIAEQANTGAEGEAPIVDDVVPIEETTTTTTPAPTTTTALPTPTTLSPTPPLPDMSGTDFSDITNQFLAFEQWLRANPDAALVQAIFERDSPAFGHVFHEMENAAAVPQKAFEVRAVSVGPLGGSKVKVVAGVHYDDQVVTEHITFNRQPDNTWRAVDRVVR